MGRGTMQSMVEGQSRPQRPSTALRAVPLPIRCADRGGLEVPMARRSDHTRDELEALILAEAHKLLAVTGLQRFSAREVAKRIGYSVGTLYNVFGSLDRMLLAVNSRTFVTWAAEIAE